METGGMRGGGGEVFDGNIFNLALAKWKWIQFIKFTDIPDSESMHACDFLLALAVHWYSKPCYYIWHVLTTISKTKNRKFKDDIIEVNFTDKKMFFPLIR